MDLLTASEHANNLPFYFCVLFFGPIKKRNFYGPARLADQNEHGYSGISVHTMQINCSDMAFLVAFLLGIGQFRAQIQLVRVHKQRTHKRAHLSSAVHVVHALGWARDTLNCLAYKLYDTIYSQFAQILARIVAGRGAAVKPFQFSILF